jgi:hypothetical protein
MVSKEQLLEEQERLSRSKDALMASQTIADLNAINGGLQTIAFLLEKEESEEADES